MKLVSTLLTVILLQTCCGPQLSESILRPVIKLRPKISLGKAREADDLLGVYRILGKTLVGCYLLFGRHHYNPLSYAGLKPPVSVTFSVGKKIESTKSNEKYRQYDDDGDDDDDEPPKKRNKYSDDKSVKHIIVSHKFLNKPTAAPPVSVETLMSSLMAGTARVGSSETWSSEIEQPLSAVSSDLNPMQRAMVASQYAPALSAQSAVYSSTSPVVSIIKSRSELRKRMRAKESEKRPEETRDDMDEEDSEDDETSNDDYEFVDVKGSGKDEARESRSSRANIYSYKDSTVSEPKFKFGFRHSDFPDYMKYAESSHESSIQWRENTTSLDDSGLTDLPSKRYSSLNNSTNDTETPGASYELFETIELSNSSQSDFIGPSTSTITVPTSEKINPPTTIKPSEESATMVGNQFLEEIRRDSFILKKTEALGKLQIEKKLGKETKKDSELNFPPIHEKSLFKISSERRNRRKLRKHRNRKSKKNGDRRRRKSRRNRRVLIRRFDTMPSMQPIFMPTDYASFNGANKLTGLGVVGIPRGSSLHPVILKE